MGLEYEVSALAKIIEAKNALDLQDKSPDRIYMRRETYESVTAGQQTHEDEMPTKLVGVSLHITRMEPLGSVRFAKNFVPVKTIQI